MAIATALSPRTTRQDSRLAGTGQAPVVVRNTPRARVVVLKETSSHRTSPVAALRPHPVQNRGRAAYPVPQDASPCLDTDAGVAVGTSGRRHSLVIGSRLNAGQPRNKEGRRYQYLRNMLCTVESVNSALIRDLHQQGPFSQPLISIAQFGYGRLLGLCWCVRPSTKQRSCSDSNGNKIPKSFHRSRVSSFGGTNYQRTLKLMSRIPS
jgi:hypothetical protein